MPDKINPMSQWPKEWTGAKHPAVVDVLTDCRAALLECDRDGDYPLIERIDAELTALRAQGARVPRWSVHTDAHGSREYWLRDADGTLIARGMSKGTAETLRAMLSSAPTAPQADSTPLLHVGESRFESWFSEYESKQKGAKQQMRDAYAAGMGDPLVTYATAPQVGDALQGAACWIVEAIKGSRADHIAEIQQRLLIGYNRAARLYDAATQPTDTPQSAPSAQGGV
jgi:DNA segregation ATPase FtsK/SpoIIIE-like protein